MIKHTDGSVSNVMISFGQLFGKGKSKYTHAGLLSNPEYIVEMSGSGMYRHKLSGDHNNQTRYTAFMCYNRELGRAAANVADMMVKNFGHGRGGNNTVGYSMGGAIGSIWSRTGVGEMGDLGSEILDKLLQGGESYFCSGHVVLCYQIAASQLGMLTQTQTPFPIEQYNQLFALKDNCYQPAYLEKVLRKPGSGFRCSGEYLGDVYQGPG